MAILGFQLISTLIGVSVLSKIITKSTFTINILCKNLYRYLVPSDEIILFNAGLSKVKNKSKKGKNEPASNEFSFPRETEILLKRVKFTEFDVVALPLFNELHWLCNFLLCVIFVYISNEIYNNYFPQSNRPVIEKKTSSILLDMINSSNIKLNLSLLWWIISIFYASITLKRILGIFFTKTKAVPSNNMTPELLLVLGSSFMFFVLSFFFLTFDKKLLDFKLTQLHAPAQNQSIDDQIFTREKSQTILSLFAGTISGLFLFPAMRYGRMFLDSMQNSESFIMKSIYTLNFLMPFFLLLLWFIPFTNFFLPMSLSTLAAFVSSSNIPLLNKPTMFLIDWTSPANLASFRLTFALLTILLRCALFKINMQAYLTIPKNMSDKIRKEPGKISNIEYRKSIDNFFCCFNLIASQYIAPIVFTLGFMALYKNCSGLSWFPWLPAQRLNDVSLGEPTTTKNWINLLDDSESFYESMIKTKEAFQQILHSMKGYGHLLSDCYFGFILWWSMLSWFTISIVGLFYYKYAD